MGKTILELFKKADIKSLNVQDGNPAAIGGKTMEERYDIKNSKDIRVSSSAPLMGLSFFALNKIRLASNERKKETFLEEELVGLRTLRGLSSLTLYGSDILRLKLESTPVVEKMKQSANGSDSSKLSKFGQQLKQTRDEVNKFLKIPTPLNPTEYYKKLQDYTTEPWELNGVKQDHYIPVYDTMEKISEIKNAANGSLLGKMLKNSVSSGGALGKQILGNSIATAKKSLKKKILGTPAVSTNGNNNFLRVDDEGEEYIKYSQSPEDRYSIGKASPKADDANTKYNLRDKYNNKLSKNPNYPTITLNNGIAGSITWYNGKFENLYKSGEQQEILNERFISTSPNRPYTLNINGGGYAINSASPVYEDELKKFKLKYDTFGIGYNKNGVEKIINVNDLRPPNLKDVKDSNTAPSYSKPYTDGRIKRSIYGNLENTLEERGLGTNKDIINQTGRFSASDLPSYNNIYLDDLDLIPLKFEKVNDKSIVYFRSIITGFTETFTPSWDSSKFLGSPFSFYSYTGIERKVSFTLKVYAMSNPELIMMWNKLEYLAQMTYPHSYLEIGIEPSLLYFTLGSMYIKKPAIVTSLTYNINDNEQLWEIGGGRAQVGIDKNGKSRYEESFSGKFNIGQNNDTPMTLLNGEKKFYSNKVVPKFRIKNENYWSYGYKAEEIPKEDITPIKTKTFDADMDEYKLPKFINVQIELTFLESQNNTQKNLYSYGKPIRTTGASGTVELSGENFSTQTGTF